MKESVGMTKVRAGVFDTVGPDGVDRKEKHDCVVRAVSFVTDVAYWRVYDALQYWGRKPNTGYHWTRTQHALDILGVDHEHHTLRKAGGGIDWEKVVTVGKFRKTTGRHGLWLVSSRTHMMGIRDGVPNNGSRYEIVSWFKIFGFDEEKLFERMVEDSVFDD